MALRAPIAPDDLITGDELARMVVHGPSELVEGRIVPLSPTGEIHGRCELIIGSLIHDHARRHGLGTVAVGERHAAGRRRAAGLRSAGGRAVRPV